MKDEKFTGQRFRGNVSMATAIFINIHIILLLYISYRVPYLFWHECLYLKIYCDQIDHIGHNGSPLFPFPHSLLFPFLPLHSVFVTILLLFVNLTIYGANHVFITTCSVSRRNFYTLYIELYYRYRNLVYAIHMGATSTTCSKIFTALTNFKRPYLPYV